MKDDDNTDNNDYLVFDKIDPLGRSGDPYAGIHGNLIWHIATMMHHVHFPVPASEAWANALSLRTHALTILAACPP